MSMEIKTLTERKKQSAATRDRIFEAAADLIGESGFEKVTIRDICKKADVAIGTFYIYFKSKYEILYELYRKADELFEKKQINKRNDLNVFDKIIELIKTQMSTGSFLHFKTDAVKHLYIYQITSDNKYFLSEDRVFHKQLRQVIADGQQQGLIRTDMSSHDISWRILRFSRGIIFDWLLHNCDYDVMELSVKEVGLYIQCFKKSEQGK